MPNGLRRLGLRSGIFLALLWVTLLYLCSLFPYSGDDWAWGSSIGIERLTSMFENYNGRYLGNLLVLLLTRNEVLRNLVVSSTLTAIACLCYSISGKRRRSTLAVSAILLLLIYYRVGAQSIVWTSGFVNYAVPTLLILVYIDCSKALLEPGCRPAADKIRVLDFGMFFLAMTNSLFMENITLFNIAIGITVSIYCRLANGYWPRGQIAFLAGAAIGALIMFTNGSYWIIVAGQDGYRSIPGDVSGSIVSRLTDTMAYYLAINNWAIPACIFLTMTYGAVARNETRVPTRATGLQAPEAAMALVMLGICAISVYCVFIAESEPGPIRMHVATAAFLVFAVALVAYLAFRRREQYARVCLLLVASIALIAAPLLVVNPIGPRNFFPTYVLECAIACCLWDALVDDPSAMLKLVLGIILASVIIRWLAVYSAVHEACESRNSAIAVAVASGEESVKIQKLPYEGYVHCPDPDGELWEQRYKLFHGIPEEFDIEM